LINIHRLKTNILQVNFYILHAVRLTYSAVEKICALRFLDVGHRVQTPPRFFQVPRRQVEIIETSKRVDPPHPHRDRRATESIE
jgi:hypothetical protein